MRNQLLLAIAPALLSLTATSVASAEVVQVRSPVAFTLNACTQLPGLVVNGAGESFVVLTTRVDRDGNVVIERNDLVTGTAIDSNGATYIFNYHNHATMTIPPTGVPFSVSTTDHFNLVGNGKANQLQVHFVADFTVYSLSPFTATATFRNIHGDPSTCDPI